MLELKEGSSKPIKLKIPPHLMAKRSVKLCQEKDCKNEQTTVGYCRIHYLKNWKKIREKQKKKAVINLNKYVEHIMRKHPDNYVETLKHDLHNTERLQKRADRYSDDDFHDVLEDVDMGQEVKHIVENLKVDESY